MFQIDTVIDFRKVAAEHIGTGRADGFRFEYNTKKGGKMSMGRSKDGEGDAPLTGVTDRDALTEFRSMCEQLALIGCPMKPKTYAFVAAFLAENDLWGVFVFRGTKNTTLSRVLRVVDAALYDKTQTKSLYLLREYMSGFKDKKGIVFRKFGSLFECRFGAMGDRSEMNENGISRKVAFAIVAAILSPNRLQAWLQQ
jgi:hypothetical protein